MGAVAVLGTALAAAPLATAGQEVRGRLLSEDDGRPLAGAVVSLAGDSAAVASTLTRADGWFQLEAPAAGRYTVRTQLLGHRTVEILVGVGEAEPVWLDLATGTEALRIEGVTAEVDRGCDVDPEEGARVLALWNEVSKAFQAAALAEDQGLYRLRLDQWRRALDPGNLRVLEEIDRREGAGRQRSSPFESLPAEELEAGGYIQGSDREGWRYYAPDARVLLSRSFQATHCFEVEEDTPEERPEGVAEDAWTGIRFSPRDREEPDIRGVLWIDGESLEPRRLDFRYTDLPWPVDHDELGGRVGFRRLPEGPWIVSDWRIRMPVIDAEEYRPYASASLRLRHTIARLTEVGGRVTEVARRGGPAVTFGETGAVEGVVREASGEGAAGAPVGLAGTFFRTVADTAGRFRLQGVPGGLYRIVATSPAADSLGLDGDVETEVRVRPRGSSEVEVSLPPLAALLAEQCPSPLEEGAGGMLRGVVAPGELGDVEGVSVELSWTASVELQGTAASLGAQEATRRALVPVGEDGRWMACGVPVEADIQVTAVRDDAGRTPVSREQEVRLAAGEAVDVVLRLSGDAAFEAPVELEGLTVEVATRVREDLRDVGIRREGLGRRFITTDEIRRSIQGAMNATHLVERQRLPGVGVRNWTDFQCVYMRRATAPTGGSGGTSEQRCAQVVVDGVQTHNSVLEMIPPENVAAIAFLSPMEAGARFRDASGGILYIWTHGGVEGARDGDDPGDEDGPGGGEGGGGG